MTRPVAYLLYCPADSATAHAIQRGLQRFRRSFWQKDAIDVRVDPTPAVDEIEPKVVLVVSAASAASSQFDREVAAWVDVNGTAGILLVVLTHDGDEFRWGDPQSAPFRYVPESVRSGLVDEPRHLQIPSGRPASELSLRHDAFRDQLAQLVASVRGVRKDEVDGEDIRQQRRRNRLAFSALGVVLLLLAAAGVLATVARNQQQAADEQEILAQEAAEVAETQTRLTAATELAATVLANGAGLEQGRTDLLAVAAYQLHPSAETRAALASRTVVWHRYEPQELVESNQYDFPFLDDRGVAVYPAFDTGSLLFTSGTDGPVQRVELSGVDRVITAGGHGRWLLAARELPEGDQNVFDYDNAASLPAGNIRDWSSVTEWRRVDPAAGPQTCVSALGTACQEAVLVELKQGGELIALRTELGIDSGRPSPGDPQWPDPVRQHRFTADGGFLLSHDAVADQLVVTDTASGRSQTIWVDGDDQLADFGIIDDRTGWRLHGTILETLSLTDGRTLESYDLALFGQPLSADFFPGGDRAVVGFAPSNYQIIDLAGMATVVSATVGDLAEEIDISPNGQWITTSGADFLYLLDGETLLEIDRISVQGARNDLGVDEAEVSFDPSGRGAMMRLMNPSGYSVSVADLDPVQWQQEICRAAGRSLTAAEWDEHVGLDKREDVCPPGFADEVAAPEAVSPESAAAKLVEGAPDEPVEEPADEPVDEPIDDREAAPAADAPGEEEGGDDADIEPDRQQVVLVGTVDGLGGVSFGESEVVTVQALKEQLGEPTDQFVCNDLAGCGPHDPLGVFVIWGGLSVHISDVTNTFSSYFVSERSGEPAPAFETERGVRLGTSVAELLAAYPELEQFSGCADYDAVYEPVSVAPGDGEFIDRATRHIFSVADQAVASIEGSTESAFWFWAALSCLP